MLGVVSAIRCLHRLLPLAGLLVALTLPLTASAADVPQGFTFEPVISLRAAYVTGKPVTIYCASTAEVWSAYITTVGTPADFPNGAASAFGYTPVDGATTAYLAPATCNVIHTRLRGRAVNLPTLGAALDVLTVESLHMRGDVDDGITACHAIHLLPKFLFARWGFRNGSLASKQVMYGARNYLSRQPSQYHTAGC